MPVGREKASEKKAKSTHKREMGACGKRKSKREEREIYPKTRDGCRWEEKKRARRKRNLPISERKSSVGRKNVRIEKEESTQKHMKWSCGKKITKKEGK